MARGAQHNIMGLGFTLVLGSSLELGSLVLGCFSRLPPKKGIVSCQTPHNDFTMQSAQDLVRGSRGSSGRRSTPPTVAVAEDHVSAWVAACRPGWSLPGPFYSNQAIYQADIDRIWRR